MTAPQEAPLPQEASSGALPDYTPQVGDVVEFEYNYSRGTVTAKGLVYGKPTNLRVWHTGEGRLCQGDLFSRGKRLHRKIGSSSIDMSTTSSEAHAIAKAYFSKQASKPKFKVGDKVVILEGPSNPWWETVGDIEVVTRLCDDGTAWLGNGYCYHLESFRPPPPSLQTQTRATKKTRRLGLSFMD